MPTKTIYRILTVFLVLSNFSIANAQNFMGVTGGYSAGAFTNFIKDPSYEAIYHFKPGIVFSSFYENKMNSVVNFKLELQYRWQNADMEVKHTSGTLSSYSNIDYSFHLLNLNLIYSFRMVERKTFQLYFLFGLSFAYNVNTVAKGNGWDPYHITQTDTSGNTVHIMTTQNWKKNERNSKDLSTFNIGIDAGLEVIIPINNRLDFLVQNRYNLFLASIMAKKIRYTSLFTGYLNIGFRYNFHNCTAATPMIQNYQQTK